jgi:hypothetical protein
MLWGTVKPLPCRESNLDFLVIQFIVEELTELSCILIHEKGHVSFKSPYFLGIIYSTGS